MNERELARLQEENARLRALVAQAEEAERRYQALVDDAVQGFFRADPEGRYLYANRALARIYGYASPEELMTTATAAQLYLDPAKRAEQRRIMEEKGEVRGFEAQRVRKDGSIIWAAASIRAVRGPDGAIRHFEGMVEDITARKLAELSLQAERRGLETIVEGSNAGVLVVEAGSRKVLVANQEVRRITGTNFQPGDGLEAYQRAFTRRHLDGRPYALEEMPISRALDRGETVQSEDMLLETADGRMVPVRASATPVMGEDGRISAAIAVFVETGTSSVGFPSRETVGGWARRQTTHLGRSIPLKGTPIVPQVW